MTWGSYNMPSMVESKPMNEPKPPSHHVYGSAKKRHHYWSRRIHARHTDTIRRWTWYSTFMLTLLFAKILYCSWCHEHFLFWIKARTWWTHHQPFSFALIMSNVWCSHSALSTQTTIIRPQRDTSTMISSPRKNKICIILILLCVWTQNYYRW